MFEGDDLAKIGFEVDTSDLSKGEKALDDMATEGERTDKRLASFTKNTDKNFNMLAKSIGYVGVLLTSFSATTGFAAAINLNKEFGASISNLSAITGAVGEDLEYYREQAKDIGETTTLSATQAAEAFKIVASAKPDLLESAEALSSVTREAVTLAEAASIDIPTAANAMATSLNQFGEEADQANRYINVLAAGAKFGASEIDRTAEALKNSGTAAAAANVSFEETNALIQVLAANALKGAEGGTALRNIILKLDTDVDKNLRPSVVGVSQALQNLIDKELDATELTKMFGMENVNSARILMNNISTFQELTDKITGTNVAMEQAQTNVDNLAGDYKAMGSAAEGLGIAVGEVFDDSARASVQGITEGLRSLTENLDTVVDVTTDVGTVFAGVIGGKMVAASVAGAKSFITLTAAQLKATATTNAYTGAVTRTTVGMNVMSMAGKGLASTMAFLGGPIGVVTTAATLAYVAFSDINQISPELKSTLDSLGGELDDAAESWRNMSAEARNYYELVIPEQIEKQKDAIRNLRTDLAQALDPKMVTGMYSSIDLPVDEVRVAEIRMELKQATDELERMEGTLNRITSGTLDRAAKNTEQWGVKLGMAAVNMEMATKYFDLMNKSIKDNNKQTEDQKKSVDTIIKSLEDEYMQVVLTADAYLEYQLRKEGAEQADIDYALKVARTTRELKAEQDKLNDSTAIVAQGYSSMGSIASGVFSDLINDSDNAFNNILSGFENMLTQMAQEAIQNEIQLQFGSETTSSSSTSSSAGAGAMAGGWWAAIAVAVVAAGKAWNESQNDKFTHLASEVRQGFQSTGTILGSANEKSQSIANASEMLASTAQNALDVNYDMLSTLKDIRTGITGVAEAFARTGMGQMNSDFFADKDFRKQTLMPSDSYSMGWEHRALRLMDDIGLYMSELDKFALEFWENIGGKIAKEIFNVDSDILDSGIEFFGNTLKELINGGLVSAQNYADIETEKKLFGISIDKDLETMTESIGAETQQMLTQIFLNAGDVLSESASALGVDFSSKINKLFIDSTRLSLEGLEGDALVAEIESFFSATFDKWADVILSDTEILNKYQQVGEGSFETMVRVASQTQTVTGLLDQLGYDIDSLGDSAVDVSQSLISASGGMEQFSSAVATLYNEFFTDVERLDMMGANLKETFEELGVEWPTFEDGIGDVRTWFRELIMGQDVTTEAGAKLYSTLIGLSGPFDEYLDLLAQQSEYFDAMASGASSITFDPNGMQQSGTDANGNPVAPFTDAFYEARTDIEMFFGAIGNSANQISSLNLVGFIEAIGGLGSLSEALEGFSEVAFSAQETFELSFANITSIYDEIGVAVPRTREQFLELLAAQDLTTQSGRETAAALISASNATGNFINSLDAYISQMSSETDNAFGVLSNVINREVSKLQDELNSELGRISSKYSGASSSASNWLSKTTARFERSIDAAGNKISKFESLISSLGSAIEANSIKSIELDILRRKSAQKEIENAILSLRAGNDIGDLTGAIQTVSNVDSQMYSSQSEMDLDMIRTARSLEKLEEAASDQISDQEKIIMLHEKSISSAERQYNGILASNARRQAREEEAARKAYDMQVEKYNEMLANATLEINELRGIDTSLLSVDDAFSLFLQSLNNEREARMHQEVLAQGNANNALQMQTNNWLKSISSKMTSLINEQKEYNKNNQRSTSEIVDYDRFALYQQRFSA